MERRLRLGAIFAAFAVVECTAASIELQPASASDEEEFEIRANKLQPGDELVLRGGVYSQTGRRAVKVKGTAERPIIIRAATNESPILTRPASDRDGNNNIEFVDCEYLVVRGLHFQGGSSGAIHSRPSHHLQRKTPNDSDQQMIRTYASID